MRRYVDLANTLDSFGSTKFFMRAPRGHEILSINGDGLTQMDASSRNVMSTWGFSELAGWTAKDDLLQVKVATGILKWAGPEASAVAVLLSEHVAFKVRQTQAPKTVQKSPEEEKNEECLIM
jgi:hypothetical protein